jgi:hypothetical protein
MARGGVTGVAGNSSRGGWLTTLIFLWAAVNLRTRANAIPTTTGSPLSGHHGVHAVAVAVSVE